MTLAVAQPLLVPTFNLGKILKPSLHTGRSTTPGPQKEPIMHALLTRSLAYVVLGFGAALVPGSLLGQVRTTAGPDSRAIRSVEVTTPASVAHVDSLSTAGPRIVRAGIVAPVAIRSSIASPQGRDDNIGAGRNVAMMGVGVAAIVVGSLIGGDGGTIIAISGGVIGLVGLYRYLR
jgi:hypothetical protein